MVKDFDSLLTDLGGFGKYQKRLMVLVIIPTAFLIGIQETVTVFQLVVPDHYCLVPGRENTTLSESQWKNLTIPWNEEEKEFNLCEEYKVTWEDDGPHRSNETERCSAWVYDRSLMQETVATTNDWVCGKEKYSVHLMSVTKAGISISNIILPYITDKYTGRRLMFFISISIHGVFSIFTIFSNNFILHATMRFFSAWAFQTNYQTSYMIAFEYLPPANRNTCTFLSFVAWALGASSASLFAWAIADWRYLIATSISIDLIMWCLWWYLPESPRWLLTRDKKRETADELIKVSKVNGVQEKVDEKYIMEGLQQIDQPVANEVSLITAIKYPRFCMRVLLLFIISSANILGYGILSLNINVLPNRYFLNGFILYIIEIPSNVCSTLCVQYIGRKFTTIFSLAICVGFSVIAVFVVEYKVVLLVLVTILKFSSTMVLYNICLQIIEICPTTLRSTGMGALVVASAATMSLVPYIIHSSIDNALNYWVMMGSCLICLVLYIPIPETLGLPLPQTLFEAENLGVDRPYLKWIHHWNLHKFTDSEDNKKNNKKIEDDSKL